jgi:hypothetical protein
VLTRECYFRDIIPLMQVVAIEGVQLMAFDHDDDEKMALLGEG